MATIIRQVAVARDVHDNGGCPYNAVALEVHFNPSDGDRLGLDDGEDIAGLTVRLRRAQRVGWLRVFCDVELFGSEPQAREYGVTTRPGTGRERVPVA